MDKVVTELYRQSFIDKTKAITLWEYDMDINLMRANLDNDLISQIPDKVLKSAYTTNSTRAVVENIYISITPMFVQKHNNEYVNVYFKQIISNISKKLDSITNESIPGEFKMIENNIYTTYGIGRYKYGFQVLDDQNDVKYRIYIKQSDKGDHKPIFAIISAKELHLKALKDILKALEKDIKLIFKYFNHESMELKEMDKQVSRIDICNHNNIYSVDDFVYKRERFKTRIYKGTDIYDMVNNKKSYSYVRIGNGDIKVRCYNKAKEIIEMQNKVFFFQMWLEKGLISEKDYYTYTLAYKISNEYEFSIRVAMVLTSNKISRELKLELLEKIRKKTSNRIDYVDRLIDEYSIEKIRPIVNIEFEAHNRFLRTVKMSDMSEIKKLNVMIENLDKFYEYLTSSVFYQVTAKTINSRKKKISSKWMLIINSEIQNLKDPVTPNELEIIRTYNHKMTCERLSSRLINSMCAYYAVIEENVSEISSTNIIRIIEKIKSSSYIRQNFIDVNQNILKQRNKLNRISNLSMQKSGL